MPAAISIFGLVRVGGGDNRPAASKTVFIGNVSYDMFASNTRQMSNTSFLYYHKHDIAAFYGLR